MGALSPIAQYAHSDQFRENLCRLAKFLHAGRFGPSAGEWDEFKPAGAPVGASLVKYHSRHWGKLLQWAGLEQGPSFYYAQAAKARLLNLESMDTPPDKIAKRRELDWPITFILRVNRKYYWWARRVWVIGDTREWR